jgi:crotonobetainyl-CoA:carnitine CoA-transferase CaiB-like acyl-CoA transferase
LNILEPADIWCANVLNYEQLFAQEGFQILDFVQEVEMTDGYRYKTTRCPIRIDGELFTFGKASPKLGQDNEKIIKEFNLC